MTEKNRVEAMGALREAEEARAAEGECEECGVFTQLEDCGSCGWRLCEEHNRPTAHNNTCTFYPE